MKKRLLKKHNMKIMEELSIKKNEVEELRNAHDTALSNLKKEMVDLSKRLQSHADKTSSCINGLTKRADGAKEAIVKVGEKVRKLMKEKKVRIDNHEYGMVAVAEEEGELWVVSTCPISLKRGRNVVHLDFTVCKAKSVGVAFVPNAAGIVLGKPIAPRYHWWDVFKMFGFYSTLAPYAWVVPCLDEGQSLHFWNAGEPMMIEEGMKIAKVVFYEKARVKWRLGSDKENEN